MFSATQALINIHYSTNRALIRSFLPLKIMKLYCFCIHWQFVPSKLFSMITQTKASWISESNLESKLHHLGESMLDTLYWSFILMKNNNGPKMGPWGTPQGNSAVRQEMLRTNKLPPRNIISQPFKRNIMETTFQSFDHKIMWFTMSSDFEKSKNITTTLFSSAVNISSVRWRNATWAGWWTLLMPTKNRIRVWIRFAYTLMTTWNPSVTKKQFVFFPLWWRYRLLFKTHTGVSSTML